MAAPERPAAAAAGVETNFLARTLDRKELRRLERAIGKAERLLDAEHPRSDPEPDSVPPLIAALEARLDEQGGEDGANERSAHVIQLEQLRSRFQQRREAFSRIEEACDQLREITSPPAILEAAPQRLWEGSELDRVLLSTVHEGVMLASSAYFGAQPEEAAAVLASLADDPIRLEHPLLEAEVLRRRRATGVTDAHLHPRVAPQLRRAMNWSSYVVAPVVVHGKVIAVLHADRRSCPLDVLDREVLWRFAVGFAQAYESAALRRGIRHEREQMGHFLDQLNARLGELSDSAIKLAPREKGAAAEARIWPKPVEDGSAFEGLLSRREVDVLELMAEGLSNRKIADRLVIAEGTVKFHVNSILKKLRAGNRAEAVSRYLTRARSTPPG